MTSSQIKLKLGQEIEQLNSTSLKELYGIVLNYFSSKRDLDEWALMSSAEKLAIEEGLADLKKGNRVSRKAAMSQLRSRSR